MPGRLRLIPCGFFALLVGCGPVAVPVSGVVSNKDVPVPEATVSFIPQSGQTGVTAATGLTDAQGRFTLTRSDGTGPLPGRYQVLVSKMVRAKSPTPSGDDGLESEETKEQREVAQVFESQLDPKWSDPAKTPLTLEIKPGMKPLTIDMADPAKTVVETGA